MRLGAIRMMGHAGWPTPPAVALLLASLKQPGHPWWTKADTHQSRYLSAVVLHSRGTRTIWRSGTMLWRARAGQARRVAGMLSPRDAALLEAYSRECEDSARAAR